MALSDYHKRVLVHVRERPTSTDLNRVQDRVLESIRTAAFMAHGETYESDPGAAASLRYYNYGPQGFFGGGFNVQADPGSPPRGLLVTNGVGIVRNGPASATDIDSASGADWDQLGTLGAPVVLSGNQTFTVPASPAPGNARIDIIEVRADYVANEPATVGVFNTTTEVYDPTVKNKSLNWDLLGRTGSVISPASSTAPLSYKQGVAAVGTIAAATEPSTTAGYVKIARINVLGGAAAITNDDIADMRPLLFPQGQLHCAGQLDLPGVVGGLGTEALQHVELPPGCVLKVIFGSSAPPAAGQSYTMQFFLIGGDLRPRTAGPPVGGGVYRRGVCTANAITGARIVATGYAQYGQLTAAQVARLDGTDPSYKVVNGVATFPEGTPYVFWSLAVLHPTGGAVSATEYVNFHFMLNMA